ncbi:hypothetical protein CHELA1G11_30023 [Hyphomicrobiales bacterium]|nr:hypothetical protein CHELA1G2_30022 [Hyphomicrobiales bacterium]CAH1696064.1 hypothetical protein CHELA1G11_30023 [Hyphomicrobiales bacterium]
MVMSIASAVWAQRSIAIRLARALSVLGNISISEKTKRLLVRRLFGGLSSGAIAATLSSL